jgi:outer membrane protein with beta-barrel domain
MRTISAIGAVVTLAFAPVCLAQEPEWEVGGAGGFGFYRNATINNPSGSANAGIDNRFAAGVVIGQDLYQHFSGEVRYTFRDGDLKLSQGSQKVNMDGDSHAIHYDMLFHLLPKSSRIRPFAAAGAGIKFFRATGKEYASQPLADFALLTKTEEAKPLISVGGGVKYVLNANTAIRFDFRDYITPFPEKLFVPPNGTKIRGWLNDFVPLVGVSFVF